MGTRHTMLRTILQALVASMALSWGHAAWSQANNGPGGGTSDANAGAGAPTYQPTVGQPGKDVVWVPTAQQLVDRMLDMAKATPADYVIDLGSGDGRTVITAAQRGIRALGIEYDPNLVQLSKENAAKAGVADKASFTKADIFESDFSSATVITLFLLPDLNLRLRPILLGMKPGTRVVSNTFTMGEWEADERTNVDNPEACKYWCTAYLWIVPAKAEGRWNSPAGQIEIKQTFQKVEGNLQAEGRTIVIADGRLRGDQISFRAGGASYTGRVAGDRIEGTVTADGGSKPWVATKSP